MSEVKIPFKKKFKKKILNREKTVTRRYKKYGNVGDCFEVKMKMSMCVCSGRFVLTRVYREPLSKVDDEEARKEGCVDLEDFKKEWIKIHPRRGWRPEDVVYVHRWD